MAVVAATLLRQTRCRRRPADAAYRSPYVVQDAYSLAKEMLIEEDDARRDERAVVVSPKNSQNVDGVSSSSVAVPHAMKCKKEGGAEESTGLQKRAVGSARITPTVDVGRACFVVRRSPSLPVARRVHPRPRLRPRLTTCWRSSSMASGLRLPVRPPAACARLGTT